VGLRLGVFWLFACLSWGRECTKQSSSTSHLGWIFLDEIPILESLSECGTSLLSCRFSQWECVFHCAVCVTYLCCYSCFVLKGSCLAEGWLRGFLGKFVFGLLLRGVCVTHIPDVG